MGSYDISERISISSVFVYATGNAVTFPSGKYELNGKVIPYFTERNGYRMPSYHRLDVSMKIRGKKEKRFNTSWDISVYNIYNRHNAYSIYFREDEDNGRATEAKKALLIIFITSFIAISCEKVIDVNLNTSSPSLVAEGSILYNSLCNVRLTYTSSYFDTAGYAFKEEAIITISDSEERTEVLEYIGEGNYRGDILGYFMAASFDSETIIIHYID